jgi:hypothetical protein
MEGFPDRCCLETDHRLAGAGLSRRAGTMLQQADQSNYTLV